MLFRSNLHPGSRPQAFPPANFHRPPRDAAGPAGQRVLIRCKTAWKRPPQSFCGGRFASFGGGPGVDRDGVKRGQSPMLKGGGRPNEALGVSKERFGADRDGEKRGQSPIPEDGGRPDEALRVSKGDFPESPLWYESPLWLVMLPGLHRGESMI